MNARILAVIIILVTNFRLCQGRRYDNYRLFRVYPNEKDHLKFLQNLDTQKYIDVIFWIKPAKLYEEVQFIVNPRDLEVFQERLNHFGMHAELMNNNVQELFDTQTVAKTYLRLRTETYTWEQYHSLKDIQQWLIDIVLKFPTTAELDKIGISAEGRDITAINIKMSNTAKQTVIVEGGSHGNEWITTEFVMYLANEILHIDSSSESRLKSVAMDFQWILIPVVNPDGYQYSHVVDRLWRKNRRLINKEHGVDLNRNFDYSFGKFGTSDIPADETYCGPHPFSEPETRSLSEYIRHKSRLLKFYFSMHSYGQKIIIPYGDRILHLDNYSEMENFAKQAALKIYRTYGVKYAVGTTYDTLGQKISGDSASWVKKTFGIPYVFTFLLRDNGTFGYALPPEEILPSCKEVMNGLLEIMTTNVRAVRADIFEDSAVNLTAGCLVMNMLIFWLLK